MKRTIYFLMIFIACWVNSTQAQNIALYEHVPRIRVRQWYNDQKPQLGEYVFLAFIDGRSEICRQSVLKAKAFMESFPSVSLLVLVKLSQNNLPEWLKELAQNERIGILLDSDYSFFEYGIFYSPVGILVDHRRRALWHGNPLDINLKEMSSFLTSTKNKTNWRILRKYNFRKERKFYKRFYYENRTLRKN